MGGTGPRLAEGMKQIVGFIRLNCTIGSKAAATGLLRRTVS